jgi:hypothetical protein
MTEAYVQRVWFSVIYKSTGKKKCDCGLETTAMEIVANNPQELTYVRSDAHLMGQDDIIVNMDGGVGGSWKQIKPEDEEYVHINDDPHDGWWLRPEHRDDVLPQLQESDLEPFNP